MVEVRGRRHKILGSQVQLWSAFFIDGQVIFFIVRKSGKIKSYVAVQYQVMRMSTSVLQNMEIL